MPHVPTLQKNYRALRVSPAFTSVVSGIKVTVPRIRNEATGRDGHDNFDDETVHDDCVTEEERQENKSWRNCWSEPHGSTFSVRGKRYLEDWTEKKVREAAASNYIFPLTISLLANSLLCRAFSQLWGLIA